MRTTLFMKKTLQCLAIIISSCYVPIASATGLYDIPSPAPSWWGATSGQTASLFADFSEEGLFWDEYAVGDNLQISDFNISIVDMQWVDDPTLGPGYQSTSPGEMIFTYDNLMVVTNTKHLVDKLEIKTTNIDLVGDPVVEAQWGQSGWVTGGIGSIKSKWEWENIDDTTWILSITADLTPQPDKVRISLSIQGGSGPVINRAWTGEHCTPIPEPTTLILLGTGILGMAGSWLKRHKV